MTPYQRYIALSRYARWDDDKNRRETFEETVQRLIQFYVQKYPEHTDVLQNKIAPAILNLDVMPSMRSLMTAGPALDRENLAGYNCSYLAVNNPRAFAETLYILMCGTGVGFSCEAAEVQNLPEVPKDIHDTDDVIVVQDSKEGWAKAFRKLIQYLYNGEVPRVDYSRIRPAGARLRTFGGRASGPDPLRRLFDFTTRTFRVARGRRLSPVEVHDVMCMIGEVVVVGGVRRSALISLSDLGDNQMRNAKAGAWWESAPHRALANNSAVYLSKPDAETFLEEWTSLVKSKSGERGIFNRQAAQKQAARWGRRPENASYGCNPCSEILLQDKQLCNLSEVCVRPHDTWESLKDKVEIATILGTFQATLTKFGFVSQQWIQTTEEERLLGVSLTGVYDNPITYFVNDSTAAELEKLRDHARHVNAVWAEKLGIPASTAITCVKPSGTVSQLCDTASGIHPRHSAQYLRTTRIDKKDPLYQFLKDQGLYIEDDVIRPADTGVVYFPQKAPEASVTRSDVTAIRHLNLWLMYQRHWCEHKPSVTISVKDHEWPEVGAWVYKHFDECSGISFLPYSEHTYQQAPYQEVSEAEFNEWVQLHPMPDIAWGMLTVYEQDDQTTGMQTLACVGGQCDL
jgi:ribonucleoside-diphosphate reductase alpha chain